MGWGRIDDGFHDHPKVEGLSLAAVGLWTVNFTWAHRHRKTSPIPGFIPAARVAKLGGRNTKALINELTNPLPGKKFGLWEPVEGGYLIHDFVHYLPKRRDPEELRESGRRGMAVRWGKDDDPDSKLLSGTYEGDSKGVANNIATDNSRASARASPSRPVPSPTTSSDNLRGRRSETLPAADATNPPRCTNHQDLPEDQDPGPCRGCQRARERAERAVAEQTAASLQERLNCPLCNDAGQIEDPEDGRPIGRCTHGKEPS